MKILFVSAEVSPFAKVGGLADVAGSLPKALRELGHDARVVMPLYQMIEDDPRWKLSTTLEDLHVQMNADWSKTAVYKQTEIDGLPVGFVGTDEWFTESVDSGSVYQPGGLQHLFFCAAIIRAMEELDWIPDIVHCNDWHTGFLPVLLREKAKAWEQTGTVFTIHNLAYQGEFGTEVLDALDLPHALNNPEQVEAWGRVNFLKAGCSFADRVNTVSETYAMEIESPEYGCRLDGLMTHLAHQGHLSGILNGIDNDVFNPATDPDLASNFTSENLSGKAACRADLLKALKLKPIKGAPVLGIVSRLSSQKGMDLLLEAAEAMMSLPVQLVIQGLGDPALAHAFEDLEKRFPKNFRFINRFDASLAQKVYAGCDGFLMPSSFEPCGLGQLIAMRYGTIPVVRFTGGLADTVFEGLNGFVFHNRSAMEFLAAVERFCDAYADGAKWSEMVKSAMNGDYSWDRSARRYAALYEEVLLERRQSVAQSA